MTAKIKYPKVIADMDRIIYRLLNDDITRRDLATEYGVPYHTMYDYIKRKATLSQQGKISKRGFVVAGRQRRGIANNPAGGKKVECKIKAFTKIYADPLSPVKHRVARTGTKNAKNLKFTVQSKLDDGVWYDVDLPDCENAAFVLVERLYLYKPDDITAPDCCIDQESA